MADEGTQETQEQETFTREQYEAAMQSEREALLAKRDEALKEAKAAKDKLRAAEQKAAEEAQQKKAEKAGITSQELDRMRAEVRQALEAEYAVHKTTAETLAKENRALKLDNVVKKMMGENGATAKRIDDLYRLTADHFDLTDDGKPMLKDKMGLPVETFIKEDLRKAYPEWFDGSGSSGGGATKSIAGGGGSTRVIAADDTAAFMANLERIAKGEVQVR